MSHISFPRRARGAAGAVALGALALTGCDNATDTLLEAIDPDLINPVNVQSAEGAQALYIGAFGRLRAATIGLGADDPGAFLYGGLLADEWSTSSTYVQNDETDQRQVQELNSLNTVNFRALNRVRTSTNQAIASLREFRASETSKIAEMYMLRAFAETQLAQDFCNGIPLSDAAGDEFLFGDPQSVEQVFTRAVASYDSALALVTGTDANSVLIARAARVGKARALLGVNKVAEAAALVPAATVPTAFSYDLTHSLTAGTNTVWGQNTSARRFSVADSLEGNARDILVRNQIPFFSSRDPRLPVTYSVSTNGRDTTKSQDGLTFSRTTSLYGQLTSLPLISGLDARLIEAEARLVANDVAGMMTILNALRAAPPRLGEIQAAALPALAVPATRDAAVNLYFREKAFWTFSRGQRLGDLRRLVRFYGRTPETTFPEGRHFRGGEYGDDVNFPIPINETVNPNYKGCTDRRA